MLAIETNYKLRKAASENIKTGAAQLAMSQESVIGQ
jgi:hypothetical protein